MQRSGSASSIDSAGFSWPSKGTQLRNQETPEQAQQRIDRISAHVEKILLELGEDPSRQGIQKTPERYAKALLFLTRGYEMKLDTIV